MKYAIIGSGKIGTALAHVFARKNIEVAIANSGGPETLASVAEQLGASIVPKSAVSASGAAIIFLAVPFSTRKDLAAQLPHWHGKIIVDVTNAFHVAPEELGDRLSSEIIAEAFTGARVVKAFNHHLRNGLERIRAWRVSGRPCSYRIMNTFDVNLPGTELG